MLQENVSKSMVCGQSGVLYSSVGSGRFCLLQNLKFFQFFNPNTSDNPLTFKCPIIDFHFFCPHQFFNVLSNFVSPTVKITSVEEKNLGDIEFPLLFKVRFDQLVKRGAAVVFVYISF